MQHKTKYILVGLGWSFFWIAVWEFSVCTTRLSEIVPSLIDVMLVFKISQNRIEIFDALFGTLKPTFLALGISCIVGYSLGILMGLINVFKHALYSLLNALKSIPVTVFIPVFIVLFGLTSMIVPLICVPLISIIAVNIADACLKLSENRFNQLRLYSISKSSFLIHVVFWETLEVLLSTLRVVLTYAIALVVAIDYFLPIERGIGDYIHEMYYALPDTRKAEMFAGIFLLGIIGILLVKLLDIISNNALIWKIKK